MNVNSENELFNKAKQSGLFNPYWYMKQYNLKFDTEEEVFLDYIRKSKFDGINPSKDFDGILYLLRYRDVFESGESPFIHYLNNRITENRIIDKQRNLSQINNILQCNDDLIEKAKELKIAISFHIYYVDFIKKYSDALIDFPIELDLYITMNDENAKEAIEIFSRNKMIKNIKCVIVPNKGRNFGPLLVEFAEDLSKYDLFAHLHSKKSLYSGKEQTQWADYVIEYLLNDKQVITKMLNLFAQNKDFGMYFPTTFWGLPYWANHWLKNYHLAKNLYPDIKITNSFIAYPASGMFWARPEAIKDILGKEYSYTTFPDEPIANDGTMLHVIERILSTYCEKNNYKQFFYYSSLGQFSLDKRYTIETYYNESYETLKRNLLSKESISFDLFDTLFIRKYYYPDYAKKLLGDELVKEKIVESTQVFVELRNTTEFEIRKRKNFIGDVSIDEVYLDISKKLYGNDNQAKHLANREFEIDLDMFIPRNMMIELINRLSKEGKKILFITDTYYTKDQIESILAFCSIEFPYDLFVSSSNGLRKDNGTVWEYIINNNVINLATHLHIGDNLVSDIQIPSDHGFKTIHIMNPIDKWEASGYPHENNSEIIFDDKKTIFFGNLISKNGYNPFFQ